MRAHTEPVLASRRPFPARTTLASLLALLLAASPTRSERASERPTDAKPHPSPPVLRLDGPGGHFIADQSALPPDAVRADAGFVGYYVDDVTRNLFVFSQLLFTDADVSAALGPV
jgi:hypothetical protein